MSVPPSSAPSQPPAGRDRDRPRDRLGLGILLVVVGGILLLRDGLGVSFRDWWVVFLLIPAAVFLYRAFRAYQASGAVDREVTRSAVPGLVLVLVSAVFLFGLSWGVVGPLLLIGLGLLLFARR